MNIPQKKNKLNSMTKLVKVLKNFPEEQSEALAERIKLKAEIQAECDHDYIDCGCVEVCVECNKTKLT